LPRSTGTSAAIAGWVSRSPRSTSSATTKPQEPLCEFAAADDHEQTSELVAVIRGSDGGRRMYSAGDPLPAVYAERFRTQIHNERIVCPGAWNKLSVVARDEAHETMRNHALIQSRRRYRA
jgi:hypothetical protein